LAAFFGFGVFWVINKQQISLSFFLSLFLSLLLFFLGWFGLV